MPAKKIQKTKRVMSAVDENPLNEDELTGRRMDVSSISDEELLQLFEEKFEEAGAKVGLTSFEVTRVVREVRSKKVEVEVEVFSMAGEPTSNEFKNDKVDLRVVTVSRYDKGDLRLKLKPKKTVQLNGTDYMIVFGN